VWKSADPQEEYQVSINRNALKNYAPKARQGFIAAAIARAAKFGISETDTVPVQEQGDVVIIGGEAFPRKIGAQRKALAARIKLHGFGQTMEEVAYTWFNRFLAIRYMEVHGYLDHGYRVLSHPDGGDLPEILEYAEHLDLAGLDTGLVEDLKLDGNKDAELYRLLLVAQCNALHGSMPFLFEKIDDETELLLPDNLLHSDSLIRQLVNEIDEADWQEIEIIGWLYQFYISEKKDQVIGKVVKSEDIPAATQLFTPNWIVKYMVQNSLGHQWMATYPESSLKDRMEYYIEPAEQTVGVQAQLAEITPKELNPEELTLLDPAAGSGHILVEAYDLFKQIYLERGYRLKDIPRLILEKNLYGLDIDDRAAQMAGFALLMKARADDRRILSNPVHLNLMSIQSSEGLDAADVAKHLLAATTSGDVETGTIEALINLFEDAKTFGSLISVPEIIGQALPALGKLLDQPSVGDLLQRQNQEYAVRVVRPLAAQANMLERRYDCVVANPPYMGGKGMNGSLKRFTKQLFPISKADLFACFITRGIQLGKSEAMISMITMESWMFLSSYQDFRHELISRNSLFRLAHFPYDGRSPTVMGLNFGLSVISVCRAPIGGYKAGFCCARYHELRDNGRPKEFPPRNERLKSVTLEKFSKIEGSPIAYWVSDTVRGLFSNLPALSQIAKPRQGLATSDNDRFLRRWFEPNFDNIGLGIKSRDSALASGHKWFPCQKGGPFRKWYGNNHFVINWENDGSELLEYAAKLYGSPTRTIKNIPFYFREGITWSTISSSALSMRYSPWGFISETKGAVCFSDNRQSLIWILGFSNSKLINHFLKAISPTLDYHEGPVGKLPIYEGTDEQTLNSVERCIAITKSDWDDYETSWDFTRHIFLHSNHHRDSIAETYIAVCTYWSKLTLETQQLEEANNRLFIDGYGLSTELTPEVPLKEITLTSNSHYRHSGDISDTDREDRMVADTTRELVSFALGCMMGRYSLDEEGLIYASSGNKGFDPSRYSNFPADDDGIIPITDTEWFDDDATVRFEEFLKVAWSPETLKENLKFIGDSLANNGGNDPLKTIRNYLSKSFYKDHLKTYKKRPIYWLFSSGKQRAFECLVYLHRYNEGTLARMRMEYVTPLQSRMSARIDQLGGDVDVASSTAERNRKQKEKDKLVKQLEELREFDEELRHYADQRIALDLDDGVKVNYGKFGNLLAETKAITGKK
jgi:type II restriction/modification system DNA methylase subunit YeeA